MTLAMAAHLFSPRNYVVQTKSWLQSIWRFIFAIDRDNNLAITMVVSHFSRLFVVC